MSHESNLIFLSDDQRSSVEAFLAEWHGPQSYVDVKTSGSTGAPKTIRIEKSHMIRSAKNTLEYFGIEPGKKAFLCLSADTIAGKMMIVRSIVGHLKLFVGKVSSDSLCECPDGVNFTALVPLQLSHALENCPEKLASIDCVITGGAPVSDPLENALSEKHISVFQTFGMTETISHVAIRKIGFRKETYFNALNGITFSTGKESTLTIHCPDLGHETLFTNDVVELKNKELFKWLGRRDHVINSGGIKIHPEEVEKMLSNCIHIPFFVAGVADPLLGQKLVLVIESLQALDVKKSDLERILDKYKVPKEQHCFKSFVRTESNKINRIETLKQTPHVVAPLL